MPPCSPSARHLLVVAVAATNLLLVLGNALHLPLPPTRSAPGRLLRMYGQWAGASIQFNFFAPHVTPSVRVSFDVERASGDTVREGLGAGDEALDVRTYCMALRFEAQGNPDDMARAWAAMMFGRYPDARALTVRVDSLRMPPMERYAAGERPEWQERYRLGFEHRRRAFPAPAQAQAVAP